MMGERCESSRGEREVMGTPERSKNSQIANSIAKFEDSPVFSFLNNLSPIKPVKPMHISQTINPLSFSSLPSVFSSPHLASLRESRFLRRHSLSDPSKPEFSSDDGSNMGVTMNLDEHKESNPDANCEKVGEPPYVCSKLVAEFAETLSCEMDIVGSGLSGLEAKQVAEYACTSSAFVENQRSVNMSETNAEVLGNTIGNCWDSFIADSSDLFIFESPKAKACNESVDPATAFYRSIRNAIQNVQSFGAAACGERGNAAENMPSQPEEGIGMIENMPLQNFSGVCRGMKRRSLVFEMAGGHRKNMEDGSARDSPLLLTNSDGNASSDKQIARTKTGSDCSGLLPGIGLHLNALAATHESSTSGRLLIGSSSSAHFPPPTTSQDLLSSYLLESGVDTFESLLLEDHSRESGYIANEDINPSSPKKRRRKSVQGGDGESCKRCSCKKSKCLKLYCECFAAGVYCVEPCACIDCFNKSVHEEIVLTTRKQIESRNPLAFAPKVMRTSDSVSEIIGDDFANTPASARHKRGCNCKKSGCLKKYCECYQGGVGCSINCRCEGCKNAFGRKDGSCASAEHEDVEDENDTTEKAALDSYKASIHDDLDQRKRPPRAYVPPSSSYSGFGNSSLAFPPPAPKWRPHLEGGDEMPHFLAGGGGGGSPNRKRVTPPQTLTGPRSSRKLVLQSIPLFPSLASNQ